MMARTTASCIVIAISIVFTLSSATHLLISDGLRLLVVNDVDLSAGRLNSPGGSQAYAVDYHGETGDVYYSHVTENTSVTRGIWKYDDDRSESSLYLAAGSIAGIAVDWVHNNLYFTDSTAYTLNVVSLDTGFTRTLHRGVETDKPRAVRVDPRDDQRYVYWTDWGDNANIRRCGLDGNNCETIVDRDITWPNSITIEYVNNHLFWLEAYNPARVYRSNLDGSEKTMMMGLSGNTRGIDALDETTVYITDQQTDTVSKLTCHATHCEVIKTIRGFTHPTDVQVLHTSRQPSGTDVCSGVHCPLCLPAVASTVSHQYTCYNDQGVLTLRCVDHQDYCANGGICEEVPPRIRCRCVDPYVGPRCMQYRDGYIPPGATPTTSTTSSTTTSTLFSNAPIVSSEEEIQMTDDACTSEGYVCRNGATCIADHDATPYCSCLPGYQGESCESRNVTTHQQPWIQSVVPRYGPIAGGTRITISGQRLDVYGMATVYLGHSSNILCRDVFSNSTTIICATITAEDISDVEQTQSLLMNWQYWPDPVLLQGFMFTYKANPSVHSLSPMQTIVSGGTQITVSGAHLDSVGHPEMLIRIIVPKMSTELVHYSTCEVNIDGSEMYCVTPTLDLVKDVVPSAECRDTVDASEECTGDIEMWVGLHLDGMELYRDLRSALHQHSRLYPYLDPQIEEMNSTMVLKTWGPHSPQAITIKGSGVDYGSLNSQYTVEVGGVSCENVKVHSEKIVCHPPENQPDVNSGETRHYVNVSLGSWHQSPGYVTYETSILQCTSCTAGLFVGVLGGCALIGVAAVVIVLRRTKVRSQSGTSQQQPHLTTVADRPRAQEPPAPPGAPPPVSYYEEPIDYVHINRNSKTNSYDNKVYAMTDESLDLPEKRQRQHRTTDDSMDPGYTELCAADMQPGSNYMSSE